MTQVTRSLIVITIMGIYCFALSACDDKKSSSKTRQYVQQIKKKYTKTKPVTVTIKDIPKQSYHSADKPSPFQLLKKKAASKKHYPNAILQDHTVQSLKLIGILSKGNKIWAMITTPEGKMYKITVGTRVGNNYALVTQITQNNVKFREDSASSSESSKPKNIILTIQGPR